MISNLFLAAITTDGELDYGKIDLVSPLNVRELDHIDKVKYIFSLLAELDLSNDEDFVIRHLSNFNLGRLFANNKFSLEFIKENLVRIITEFILPMKDNNFTVQHFLTAGYGTEINEQFLSRIEAMTFVTSLKPSFLKNYIHANLREEESINSVSWKYALESPLFDTFIVLEKHADADIADLTIIDPKYFTKYELEFYLTHVGEINQTLSEDKLEYLKDLLNK